MNAATLNSSRFWAYLQLLRPANIVTAWADILAGFAASGCIVFIAPSSSDLISLAWLLLATTGLYGGGIVFNDVFDAEIDTVERPERPIPSGRASQLTASILGSLLLSIGILAASQVTWLSATLACGIAAAAILYDAYSKHHPIFGPLNMGVCRGGNLMLGVSAVSPMVSNYWFLALIPIVYIAAVTTLSRGEVHGGKSTTGVFTLVLISTVLAGLLGLSFLENYHLLAVLPFIVLLAVRVLLPFIKAVSKPSPENIRTAVRAGVLSLIVLDAAVAAGFASLPYGLLVLSLLPISMALSQMFAVT
ncbi:UbiA-like protein EboC [Brasilonema octagenarum]|uniref:Polyprenyltransferase n=1 Tax=Brasilonema octagenarum UFV-OR1 TaxID=417115 RepID=A0ABX1LZ31_9CYAN|nr:UbiA-like protein EboC [Brasilonema octagenarum]NMF61459.1 polyprenyltransferase [Brasilonema octagenarum UFV-OR1]